MTRATLDVVRVFTAPDGSGGNPLGVFVEGATVPRDRRQGVAAKLGFSETVFVEDIETGRIRIFTPAAELAFAGHPTVGTAWLLAEIGRRIDTLRVPAGEVATWPAAERQWIRARAAWVHPMTIVELPSPEEVDGLAGPPAGEGSWYAWAWQDHDAGAIRSRYFAPGIGIVEDEATGAAAIVLTDRLGRDLEIRQGRGSRLSTRVGPDGTVELGGRCVLDGRREIVL